MSKSGSPAQPALSRSSGEDGERDGSPPNRLEKVTLKVPVTSSPRKTHYSSSNRPDPESVAAVLHAAILARPYRH